MKHALIAGGSKGIGYAIAEALAKRKYDLILIGRVPTHYILLKISWYPNTMFRLKY